MFVKGKRGHNKTCKKNKQAFFMIDTDNCNFTTGGGSLLMVSIYRVQSNVILFQFPL